jgi:hypothetical protein
MNSSAKEPFQLEKTQLPVAPFQLAMRLNCLLFLSLADRHVLFEHRG